MKAVLLTETGEVRTEAVQDPAAAEDEVLVRVGGCGICGTDLHIIEEGLPDAVYPLILGHEAWGQVVAAGGPRGSPLLGSIVGIDPSLPCGACRQCWGGRPNLCENWAAIGGVKPGAWSEYVAVPVKNAHPLSEDFPKHLAVLIEPIACALHGLDRLRPQPGDSALVFGAGTMGIILSLLLCQRDVAPVVVADVNPQRRAVAERLTPAQVVDSADVGGIRASLLIDATGNPDVITSLFIHSEAGARLLIFGVANRNSSALLPCYEVYRKELTILGSMAIMHSYDRAVRAVQRHADVLTPLVTHTYALDDFSRALETVRTGRGIKTVLSSYVPPEGLLPK